MPKPSRKPSWRDYADVNHRSFHAPPSPESLHPGPSTVERAITSNAEARAIIDAYAFRFPVTIVDEVAE